MFWKFLRTMTSLCKQMYSAIYDVMKSYLTRKTRKFILVILHGKQGFVRDVILNIESP